MHTYIHTQHPAPRAQSCSKKVVGSGIGQTLRWKGGIRVKLERCSVTHDTHFCPNHRHSHRNSRKLPSFRRSLNTGFALRVPSYLQHRILRYCTGQSALLPLPLWFPMVLLAPDHPAPIPIGHRLSTMTTTSGQVDRSAWLLILHFCPVPFLLDRSAC